MYSLIAACLGKISQLVCDASLSIVKQVKYCLHTYCSCHRFSLN